MIIGCHSVLNKLHIIRCGTIIASAHWRYWRSRRVHRCAQCSKQCRGNDVDDEVRQSDTPEKLCFNLCYSTVSTWHVEVRTNRQWQSTTRKPTTMDGWHQAVDVEVRIGIVGFNVPLDTGRTQTIVYKTEDDGREEKLVAMPHTTVISCRRPSKTKVNQRVNV